jgi:hypothetical protein
MSEINSKNCESANADIKNQLIFLKGEIDQIKANTCPTCLQSWTQGDIASREAKAKELIVELQTNSIKIKNFAIIISTLPDLRLQLSEAEKLCANPLPEVVTKIEEIQSRPVTPETIAQITTLETERRKPDVALQQETQELMAQLSNPLPEITERIQKLNQSLAVF